MSAPPVDPPVSLSTSGYHDGLGLRSLIFDREHGVMLERLILRPELGAFENALRARAAKVAAIEDERFAHVRTVERDADTGWLTVLSEFVAGNRLCDLIEAAATAVRDENAAPSVDVALGFLLAILPALEKLHTTGGMAHGAAGSGRILLSPSGDVVLLDAIYAEALERLRFARGRLWTEFGLGLPPAAGPARFDEAADLAQASLSAVALVVGRPLAPQEYPDGIPPLLVEVVEIAQIRGSSTFASALQHFLQRTLPLPGQRPYQSAREALGDLQRLVHAEMGAEPCRKALAAFVVEVSAAADPQLTCPIPSQPAAAAATTKPERSKSVEDRKPAAAIKPRPAEPAAASTAKPAAPAAPKAAPPPPKAATPAPKPADIAPKAATNPPKPIDSTPKDTPAKAAEPPKPAAAPPVAAKLSWRTLDSASPPRSTAEPPPVQPKPAEPIVAAPAPAAAPQPPAPTAPPIAAKSSWRTIDPPAAIRPAEPPAPPAAKAPEPVGLAAPPILAPAPVVAPPPAPAGQAPPPPVVTAPPPVAAAPADEPPAKSSPKDKAAARKRHRGPRLRDKLRSIAAPEPPPAPAAPPPPPPAPPARTPLIAPTAATRYSAPEPLYRPPDPVTSPPPPPAPPPLVMAPPPILAPPIAVAPPQPAPIAPVAPPTPPPLVLAPVSAPPITTVPLAPIAGPTAPSAPIRLKSDSSSPVRLKADPPRPSRPEPSIYDRPTMAPVNRTAESESSSFPWKLAAAVIIVMAIGVTAGRAYLPSRSTTADEPAPKTPVVAAPSTVVPGRGSLVVETQPAGAKILIDGKPAGESPVRLDDVLPGRHVVTISTASISVKRVVRVEVGKTVSIDLPVYSGWVAIFSPIVLDISENGESLGSTEQGKLMLPPGHHALTLSNREFGYTSQYGVDIAPGEERTLNVQPQGTISINADPWAEVFIDGKRAGETPIANLKVPVGTREVLFKHPQYGERRMTVTVKASTPSVVAIDMTKPSDH